MIKTKSPVVVAVVLLSLVGGLAVGWLTRPGVGKTPVAEQPGPGTSRIQLSYTPKAIGASVESIGRPMVTHLCLEDVDQDGLKDVLYCEAVTNTVRWIRQSPRGVFTERVIGEGIAGPAHVAVGDVNGTGRLDVLVASMGEIMPNNARIGAVVILENRDNVHFVPHVLLKEVARVTDVRTANLSGHTDGRKDLVVGQFGYDQGETRWMRNLGDWTFASTTLNTQSGCIHTPVADFDQDGHEDFAALISQEWEEIHLFRGLGEGRFVETSLWGSTNEDYGSSGLDAIDLNRDGKMDLVYTNGDGFDYSIRGPRPWHGIQWLENLGEGKFAFHRVGDFPGAYGPVAADLNNDGHLDLVSVSGFADWTDDTAVAMRAWLNDGKMNFAPVDLALTPTQLMTVAAADLDGDGVVEIVTGGCRAFPFPDHLSNVTLWQRN